MIWSVDEKPPACPLVDAIGVRYSLARSRRTPASDLDSVMIIGGSPLHGSTRPAGRQLIGFGREARRDEAARKGTRMGKHAAAINRQWWPRREGPRRRARYAAGGGGGGFGGLGGGGFGGLGCSMATRQMK